MSTVQIRRVDRKVQDKSFKWSGKCGVGDKLQDRTGKWEQVFITDKQKKNKIKKDKLSSNTASNHLNYL